MREVFFEKEKWTEPQRKAFMEAEKVHRERHSHQYKPPLYMLARTNSERLRVYLIQCLEVKLYLEVAVAFLLFSSARLRSVT